MSTKQHRDDFFRDPFTQSNTSSVLGNSYCFDQHIEPFETKLVVKAGLLNTCLCKSMCNHHMSRRLTAQQDYGLKKIKKQLFQLRTVLRAKN